MNLVHEQFVLLTTQFHWLRPWWLLSLIPLVLLSVLLWRQKRHSHQWHNIIAPELLPYLMDGNSTRRKKSLLWILIAAWCISAIALAGPSWIKRPVPVEKNQNALVILLDLSFSMMSEDVKPSRIARARLKIADILRERKDGQTALVVYAGDAHTVTPISDDSATIVSLLPSLQPGIMPLQGSNTEAAIARGIQLLEDASMTQGDLLLITDGVVPEAFPEIQKLLANKPIRLHILGVGSNQPAPIASSKGGFIRDQQGAIITTKLNSSELTQLAQTVNGHYSDIANNNSDIDNLISRDETLKKGQATVERDFDQWFDQGYWLVFLLLPIALFSFKRGFILLLVCTPLIGLTPNNAYAFSLQDLWLTKDQQAQRALSAGDAKTAAEQFQSPDWQAAAQYRAGDYAAAAKSYAKSDSATAHYNRGNALAKSGDLEGAIKAYDEALKRDVTLTDAKQNRALAEAALKQQKEQQEQKKDQQQSSDNNKQDNKDQDKNSQEQQDQPQKNQDGSDQSKDGQSENEQHKDQQSKSDSSQDANQQNQGNKNDSSEPNQSQQHSSSPSDTDQANQGKNSSAAPGDAQEQASSASSQGATAEGQQASSSAASAADQALSQSSSDEQSKAEAGQQAGSVTDDKLAKEQQVLEQWLRQVPDDPGGLLRNKFLFQYQQNRQKKAYGEFEAPKNNADQRW